MSTLTPLHPRTSPQSSARATTEAPSKPRAVTPVARWAYHVLQAAWLVAIAIMAIGAGQTLGFIVLWLVGAGVIATLGFGYREFVLHDHPSSSR
jgi:hypothetical protein